MCCQMNTSLLRDTMIRTADSSDFMSVKYIIIVIPFE